jgi:hypothetical protein
MSIKKPSLKKATQTPLQSTTQLQDDSLVKLVDTMKLVETKGKRAKKNEVAQDDNNGSNYFYNEWDKIRKDKKEVDNNK